MSMEQTAVSDEVRRDRWLVFIQSLNPDINPGAVRLVSLLHRVAHSLRQVSEESLAEAGLSYAQFRLLMNLFFAERFEGCTEMNPSEISERQGISRNTASAIIRHLEEERLIERELDNQDRRKFIIRLTPAGRARFAEHASHHFRILHHCFTELTANEQETLTGLLQKVALSPCLQK
jgi:DNA-binding MarR family transcriptional regulator